MDNNQIARIQRDTAQLMEIDGAIIGRYRSYEKAAELIDGLPESIEQLTKEPEKLKELPGIGDRMVEHLQEIVKTGDYALRKKLLKKYPVTLLDLLQLQSLGPKKVAFLWSNFKAGTVADVERLAKEGKLRDLAGFGEKSEQNILKAVEVFKKSGGRVRDACGFAAPRERNGWRPRPAAYPGRWAHFAEARGRARGTHPGISRNRSNAGARRKQGQLHAGKRIAS